MQDTIYAFATPDGRSAIAVIRVSGPACAHVQSQLLGKRLQPRYATLIGVRHPISGEVLDQALAISFPGPHSFTGEDCLELHVHGGRAVRQAVSEALSHLEGVRAAVPGEFTRRAFENGKTDLTRIEGLADLIDSDTEQQRKQALAQMQGASLRKAEEWRHEILHAMSLLEATIDFADEEDAPVEVFQEVRSIAADLADDISNVMKSRHRGEILREGFKVAIAGPPNSGKSSLINYLSKRDVAIVTDIAGTTRDVLEVKVDFDGYLVRLFDTAGIRDSTDMVESIGIERAKSLAAEADLVLWLESVATFQAPAASWLNDRTVLIRTKRDLDPGAKTGDPISVSVRSGEGIAELIQLITDRARKISETSNPPIFVRERHFRLLERSHQALLGAARLAEGGQAEIVSEELRGAAASLSALIGRVDVEDVLGEIFSRFCIGK